MGGRAKKQCQKAVGLAQKLGVGLLHRASSSSEASPEGRTSGKSEIQ